MTDRADEFFGGESQKAADAGGDEQHPTFDWKAQTLLQGELIDVRVVNKKDGTVAKLAIVKEYGTGKTWTVWLTAFVLKDIFTEQAPAKGSLIHVEYKGKQPTKDGNREYGMYVLVLPDLESSDFEWWGQLAKLHAQKEQGAGSYAGSTAGAVPIEQFGPDESPF